VLPPLAAVTVALRRRDVGEPAGPLVADAAAETPTTSGDLAEGEVPPEVTITVADEPTPSPLLVWDRAVTGPTRATPDAYALRLVVSRRLYDAGNATSRSPAVAALAPGATLAVHPAEVERLGVTSGTEVRVVSARGAAVLAVVADPGVAPGVARLSHHQPGGDVDLVDVADPYTEVRLETVGGSR
jgi:anaerobic selenocysteine-containing dehydrogenase